MKERFKKSQEWLDRTLKVIPSGTQTYSKGPRQFIRGASPVFVERGDGARLWDVDGNEFLDFTMGLCAVILGYADPDVNAAVTRQMALGTVFTLPHPIETEVSEMLARLIPCAEMVRFGKNGSDATAGAVRLARAVTGRDLIACCGYHGWQDWYVGTRTLNRGVPEATRALTVPFDYNRIETLERIFDERPGQVAGVIMEPMQFELPAPGFLEAVRDLAHRHGALLIFDEIKTGFRLALGGAQERFGVLPDLAAFGKAMTNGFPLAALVGRRDIMELLDHVFFSFTAGGETVALAACRATVTKMEQQRVIEHIWTQGARLQDGLNQRVTRAGLSDFMWCKGTPPLNAVYFHKAGESATWWALKSLFQQECIRRGLLFTGDHNLSLAHGGKEIDEALRTYDAVIEITAAAIRDGSVERRLEGPAAEPVFRVRS
jgi:glutamate-1-semialdehyde aminotransferase